MAENITATTASLYFATHQASVTGGRVTAAAKKGSIKKKRIFIKDGQIVDEADVMGVGMNVVKNPTSMEGITQDYIKKLIGW